MCVCFVLFLRLVYFVRFDSRKCLLTYGRRFEMCICLWQFGRSGVTQNGVQDVQLQSLLRYILPRPVYLAECLERMCVCVCVWSSRVCVWGGGWGGGGGVHFWTLIRSFLLLWCFIRSNKSVLFIKIQSIKIYIFLWHLGSRLKKVHLK